MAESAHKKSYNLEGRTLLIPRMSDEGPDAFAAAFRSIGIKAATVLPSNERSIKLGGRYTSGDECYPEQITLGDFLRAIEEMGHDKVAFFMPTANGPCRFGQYAYFLKKVLRDMGHESIPVVSPTSSDGYDGLGKHTSDLMRTAWRGLVIADIIRKLRLHYRPYEIKRGETDRTSDECLQSFCSILERMDLSHAERLKLLVDEMSGTRARYQDIARNNEHRPLVGVVGEIFCRLSNFSNEDLIRKIEHHGGECWLSDVGEWVWYTNQQQRMRIIHAGKRFSATMLKAKIKSVIQRHDEHRLLKPILPLIKGREEPEDIGEILDRSHPYLPYRGALGEMVLSTGKAIWLYEKGASGIADISPFTCMNGIVCEAVYPRVSGDHHGIPIRVFYFDGTQKTIDQDVGIFMQLVRNFERKRAGAGF